MFHALITRVLTAAAISASVAATSPSPLRSRIEAPPVQSRMFTGSKANTGTVTLGSTDGRYTLTLSEDFKIPETPAPHWQIVDSAGNTYLLDRMKIKGDKANRSIVVPEYIHDIATVQVWCAWAEALLGETTFNGVQTLTTETSHSSGPGPHVSGRFAGAKANTGFVTHSIREGKTVLTLSEDFVTPDTPAPHWRIVDSNGKTYLLQSLKTKSDKDRGNRSIVVPAYIPDIAKVQVWCAWAEVLLGEASFDHPVR